MKKDGLFRNFGLKILALIVSVILWLAVVNLSDPVVSAPFNNIPVEILNGDIITDKGEVYEVLEGTDNISVTVSAKRTILNYLSRENLRATADLSEMKSDGTVRIRVESNRYSGSIESIKPRTEYLKVKIEKLQRRQCVITPIVSGEPAVGFVTGDVLLAENVVRVSGSESIVSKIDKVTAEASVSNMSSSIRTSVDLKFYDENDNIIDTRALNKNISSVSMTIEILGTKNLPLVLTVSGNAAYGYGVTGNVTFEPSYIWVTGKPGVLSSVKELVLPNSVINVDGANSDVRQVIDITKYLPEGIVFADKDFSGKVIATAEIAEMITKTVPLEKSNVIVSGEATSNYRIVLTGASDPLNLEVMGLAEDLAALNPDDIEAIVDLDAYLKEKKTDKFTAGNYVVPVQIKLPEGVSLTGDVSMTIKLMEKKD